MTDDTHTATGTDRADQLADQLAADADRLRTWYGGEYPNAAAPNIYTRDYHSIRVAYTNRVPSQSRIDALVAATDGDYDVSVDRTTAVITLRPANRGGA